MSKRITINIPTTKGNSTADGYICWLNLGGEKHKFFLQIASPSGYGSPHLVDYASGQIVISSNTIAAIALRSLMGNTKTKTNREVAKIALDELVSKHGIERVMRVVESAPKIND